MTDINTQGHHITSKGSMGFGTDPSLANAHLKRLIANNLWHIDKGYIPSGTNDLSGLAKGNLISLPSSTQGAIDTGAVRHGGSNHTGYTRWYNEMVDDLARMGGSDEDLAKRITGLNNFLKSEFVNPDPDSPLSLHNTVDANGNPLNQDAILQALRDSDKFDLDTITTSSEYRLGAELGEGLRVRVSDVDPIDSGSPYDVKNGMTASERDTKLQNARAELDKAINNGINDVRAADAGESSGEKSNTRENLLAVARGEISANEFNQLRSGSVDSIKVNGQTYLSNQIANPIGEVLDGLGKGSTIVDTASIALLGYALKESDVLEDASLKSVISLLKDSGVRNAIGNSLDDLVTDIAVEAAISGIATLLGVGLIWKGYEIFQSLEGFDAALQLAADKGDSNTIDNLNDFVQGAKAWFEGEPGGTVIDYTPDFVQFAQMLEQQLSDIPGASESIRNAVAEMLEANGFQGDFATVSLEDAMAALAAFAARDDTEQTVEELLKNAIVADEALLAKFPGLLGIIDAQECFPAGTQITLWDRSTKAIEDIVPGDLVLSFDPDGQDVPGRVSRLFRNDTQEFLELRFADDHAPIHVTPGHRFFTKLGEYLEIRDLVQLGGGRACVVMADGSLEHVEARSIVYSAETAHLFDACELKRAAGGISSPSFGGWQTYNFEVMDVHNYVAEDVRVHNDSILSLLSREEKAGIVRVDLDDNNQPDFAVARITRGNIEAETKVTNARGDTLAGIIETTVSDGLGNVLYSREKRNADGSVETERPLQPLYGQFQGEAVGKALTPFLTHAIIGDDASIFEQIAADTFLGTVLENFGGTVGALVDRGIQDYGTFDFGQQFEDISKGVFEDFGQELVINGVNSSIGVVNQLIMAEIFGSSAPDDVGDAVLQALAGATLNNVLTIGAHSLLSSTFFSQVFESVGFGGDQIGQITGAFASTHFISGPITATDLALGEALGQNVSSVLVPGTEGIANTVGFDPVSLIITTVINNVLPPIETLEGNIASAVTGALLASWGAFTSAFGAAAGPVGAIFSFFVGKIFDSIFEKTPQAWTNVGFNELTGRFELTGTWVDDGGDAQLSQDLAQAYVDAMNGFVDAVMSNSNNFSALGRWSFGHYEDALKNAGATGKTFAEFQDAYLHAYVEDLTNAEVLDGQRAAVRAVEDIDVEQLRIDHRLKLLLEALDDVDVVIDVNVQTVTIPGGEGETETTYTPVFADTLREKIEFVANDGDGVLIRPASGGGDNAMPALIAHPLDIVRLITSGGEDSTTSWQVTRPQLELDLQFALEQLTQSQTLLDLLVTYQFDTYDELENLGGVPQQTLDDEGIYTKVASTLQIATDYHNYLESQEEIDALILSAPTSALAAGWLQTIQYAKLLGLADPYNETGDAIGNNFFTAEADDSVLGNGGADDIRTYSGDDTIHGGTGDDRLDAGSGQNTVYGNAGDDTFVVSATTGNTKIIEEAGEGHDRLLFDARFSNINVYFDDSANGFVAEWDGGIVDTTGVETVAFQFRPDSRGTSQLIEVDIDDIQQNVAGANTLTGTSRSDYLELEAQANGQSGTRIYQGNQGDDLFVYRKDMGNVAILSEWAASGDADRLVLRDLNFDDVTISTRSTTNHDYLDLTWNDGTNSGVISIGEFGQYIETIQFADGHILNDLLIDSTNTTSLNSATGDEMLDNDRDLRIFLELLNDQDVLVGKTVTTTTTGGGENATTTTNVTLNYATSFREKVEFFATDGSDTVIVEGTSGGEGSTQSIIAGPFDDAHLMTSGAGESNASNWQITRFNMSAELVALVAAMTQSQQLVDILAQDNFLSYQQFLAADFQPVVPDQGRGIYGSSGHDFIQVNAARNTIVSNDGSDTIISTNGIDSIESGAGNDSILAGNNYDTIHSGAGHDTVDGGSGRDQIWLGTGDDVFQDNSQNNGNGHDLVYGEAGDDRLIGDGGNDTLHGGDGNDLLVGGIGADSLVGGNGDDTLLGGAGADVLKGGNGTDRVAYDDATTGLTVNLQNPNANTGDAAGDTFFDIEDVLGSEFEDALTGDAGANQIWGNNGNDTLFGQNGNDTLYAGEGQADGWQYLHGGAGNDTLVIQASSGKVGTQSLSHSEAANTGSSDTVLFSDINIADVTFATQSNTDAAWNETLIISWNVDGVEGAYWVSDLGANIERFEFADGTVLSDIKVDHWSGGRDRYEGTSKDDIIRTPDTEWAHTYGDKGNDVILGGDGRDYLYGGNGNDTLSAGGNAWDDGYQLLYGQKGSDTYRIFKDDENVLLAHNSDAEAAGEVDTVSFVDLNVADVTFTTYDYTQGGTVSHNYGTALEINWDGGQLRIANLANKIERFEFADGTSVSWIDVDMGGTASDQLHGSSKGEIIAGGPEITHLFGKGGNDTLLGSEGAESLSGGTGDDVYTINHIDDVIIEKAGEGYDRVNTTITYELRTHSKNTEELTLLGTDAIDGTGNGGDNIIRGNIANNKLDGAWGKDTIFGGDGDDQLFGKVHNDVLYGGDGADLLDGGSENDRLYGNEGNDTLIGGGGFDTLNGSEGDDQLTGNGNWDVFVFVGDFGADTITDFNVSNAFEHIDLSEVASIVNFADLSANHLSQSGSNAVIDAGDGNSITLLNVTASSLTQNDFEF